MASDVRIARGFAFTLLVPVLCMFFIGCRQEAPSTPRGPAAEVKVVEVVQKDVPIHSEWSARRTAW